MSENKYILSTTQHLFEIPPPQMQIERVLPAQTLTGLSARPGVGKTWFALEMARAVATGTKFLGEFQAIPGNVVVVGQDSSIHDYARQVRKLIRNEYDKYEIEVKDGSRLFNPLLDRLHWLFDQSILFENAANMKQLIHTINSIEHSEYSQVIPFYDEVSGEVEYRVVEGHTKGASLIVFDTLRSLSHVPENDNTFMDMVYRNIRRVIRETGATVLLLHHSGYGGEYREQENWRGASAQEAALDNWFHLLHPPRGDRDRLLLKVKRFRGLRPDDFHYRMNIREQTADLKYDEREETSAALNPLLGEIISVLSVTPHEFKKISEVETQLWAVYGQLGGMERNMFEDILLDTINQNEDLFEKGPHDTVRARGIESGQSN